VDEYVVSILAGDETETLGVVEPLHIALCSHLESPFCAAIGDSKTVFFVSIRQITDAQANRLGWRAIPRGADARESGVGDKQGESRPLSDTRTSDSRLPK
jgi:hypothetical protein